jgi:hypothetical protein
MEAKENLFKTLSSLWDSGQVVKVLLSFPHLIIRTEVAISKILGRKLVAHTCNPSCLGG